MERSLGGGSGAPATPSGGRASGRSAPAGESQCGPISDRRRPGSGGIATWRRPVGDRHRYVHAPSRSYSIRFTRIGAVGPSHHRSLTRAFNEVWRGVPVVTVSEPHRGRRRLRRGEWTGPSEDLASSLECRSSESVLCDCNVVCGGGAERDGMPFAIQLAASAMKSVNAAAAMARHLVCSVSILWTRTLSALLTSPIFLERPAKDCSSPAMAVTNSESMPL